ncbi:hypothetical protein IPA_00220 [Ignicoccus pacificus DSM 13166]|uniref:Uncharacterized protein n=1 Tax=Ignicoccus pacificus DSM 13166 TaxID=940294 RepID=A0A977PL52_9CREN|nr:hypothetical protein IPA_00220 [Ignicoccus pacificus DSM 13166]
MKTPRYKLPKDASNCLECIYYSDIAKFCLKYRVRIDDPNLPKCKPQAYFRYHRLTPEELEAELCVPNEKILADAVPRKTKVRVGDMLDALEKHGCKPKGVKRVENSVTLYLTCPCNLRALIKCDAKGCIYEIVP